jgi:hypothetical protein
MALPTRPRSEQSTSRHSGYMCTYAFYHFLRLHKITIHGDQGKTQYEICTGRKSDLFPLRTFGCRVYVEPPRIRRPVKSEIDARTAIFLGYAQSLKILLYFDLDSHEVKSAQHARYDEGMNDVPDPSPNARQIRFAQLGEPVPTECLRIPFRTSALCPCSMAAKIRTLASPSPSAPIALVHT